MSASADIWIKGVGGIDPVDSSPLGLEELIYAATSGALSDAGFEIGDIDAVSMAASDLFDGRGISTMTLTGATGSLSRDEMRVCDDGIAAVSFAADEISAGGATNILVSAWSKLSDSGVDEIDLIDFEPAFLRPLALRDEVLAGLTASAASGSPVVVSEIEHPVADASCAVVVGGADGGDKRYAKVIGYGNRTGPYAQPSADALAPVREAGAAATSMAGIDVGALAKVYLSGFRSLDSADVAAAIGVPADLVTQVEPDGADIGYCGGMLAVATAARAGDGAPVLAIGSSGAADQKAYAMVLESTEASDE